jgi:hypothetical protein
MSTYVVDAKGISLVRPEVELCPPPDNGCDDEGLVVIGDGCGSTAFMVG